MEDGEFRGFKAQFDVPSDIEEMLEDLRKAEPGKVPTPGQMFCRMAQRAHCELKKGCSAFAVPTKGAKQKTR